MRVGWPCLYSCHCVVAVLCLAAVACTAAGAHQPVDLREAEQHCGSISTPQTWGADRPHVVTCSVTVDGAMLTIAPGAQVLFGVGTSLTVSRSSTGGGLSVGSATDTQPVTLRAIAPDEQGVSTSGPRAGPWGGLVINNCQDQVALHHMVIEAGEETGTAALRLIDKQGVVLDDVDLTTAAPCGVSLDHAALAPTSTKLVIKATHGFAVCGTPETFNGLPGEGSDYTGSHRPLQVLAGSIAGVASWKDVGVAYHLYGDVNVEGGTLNIGPGVSIVVITKGVGIYVARGRSTSGFTIDGTAAQPVSIAPANSNPGGCWRGCWQGINLYKFAANVRIAHTTILGGGGGGADDTTLGQGSNDADIYAEVAQIKLDHVTLQRSKYHGLHLKEGASLTTDSTNVDTAENRDWDVVLDASAVASLPIVGSHYENLLVTDGTLATSATWSNPGVPYYVAESLEVNGSAGTPAVLTLSAGVTLRFMPGVGISFARSGAAGLATLGTQQAPVVMASANGEVAGAWTGVFMGSGTSEELTRLQNLVIDSGGVAGAAALHVQRLPLQFNGLTIKGSDGYGLWFESGATPAVTSTGLSVQGCAQEPVVLDVGVVSALQPAMVTTLSDNSLPYVRVTTQGTNTALARGQQTWPVHNVPYWLDGSLILEGTTSNPTVLTIPAGGHLLFADGAAIKVGASGGAASFITQGTASAHVVLDSGGSAQPGAWNGLAMATAAIAADPSAPGVVVPNALALTYTDIHNAGNYASGGVVRIDRNQPGAPLLSNVVVSRSGAGSCIIYITGRTLAPDITTLQNTARPWRVVCSI